MKEADTANAMNAAELEQACATDADVSTWRYEQLRRAGYDRRSARALAERRQVDLHEAIELLERGCSPTLAVNILL